MFKTKHAVIGFLFVVLIGGIFLFSKRKAVEPAKTEVTASVTPAQSEESPAPEASATPSLPKAAQGLSPKDQRKMVVLQQILESRNDNDPRMDKDLINLSPEVKHAMIAYYGEIASEKRNDRGTIVFLIGREINQKSDLEFLKKVMMEKPCLSLGDCSKSAPPPSGEAAHLEGISETTANYPQIVAIRQQVERYRAILGDPNADQGLAAGILQNLRETAHSSPNPKAVSDSEAALRYLTGHGR